MRFTNKVWRAGTNTFVVTVPRDFVKYKGITVGDLVEFEVINVFKFNEKDKEQDEIKPKLKKINKFNFK